MDDSFLLRDAEGAACGYIIARGRTLCCRISELAHEGTLYITDRLNRISEYALSGDGQEEYTFDYQGERVQHAAVFEGSKLMGASDWQKAQKAEYSRKEQKAEADGDKEKQTPPESTNHDVKAWNWPERRWPPPPCMPEARYEHGHWLTRYTEDDI